MVTLKVTQFGLAVAATNEQGKNSQPRPVVFVKTKIRRHVQIINPRGTCRLQTSLMADEKIEPTTLCTQNLLQWVAENGHLLKPPVGLLFH